MKTLKNIFIVFLATVLATTDCFAISTKCNNPFYRRTHQKQCSENTSDSTLSTTTILASLGGAALIGTGIALANKSAPDGNDSAANNTNTASQSNFARSANINQNYALSDTIQNTKIYGNYIKSETGGSDISAAKIEQIRNSSNYIQNQRNFDSIKLAWANAREFTGKNVTVNVMDDFEYYHGFAVHNIVNYIAPNATIYDSYLTTDKARFVSFDAIANIMKSAAPAHIYNSSWQIPVSASQNAATVVYNQTTPKTYAAAQQYMYNLTSHNFITEIINLATDNDSIFVWAAGNDYQDESTVLSAMPLAFPELQGHFVNVVAINSQSKTLASYSNKCGVTQNYCIAAPGSAIQTDAKEDKVYGTSFAAPIVSGAIAVIKQAFPYMSATQITALLFATAQDLGEPGVDAVYGWGLLDMEAATKPVGTPKIVLSNDNIIPLNYSNVGGIAGSAIKNANIELAFIDDFGRAFTTNLSDNINVIPYGRAFDKLTEPENNSVTLFNHFEFGFKKNNILESNGLLSVSGGNLTDFIGYKNELNIGDIKFYQQTHFGMTAPKTDTNSIISDFSNIYTAAVKTGISYNDFGLEFAIPETIVYGNAHLTVPTARANNGQIIYNDLSVDLTTNPSFEFSMKYKDISVGYINNHDYQDEFYILAKTKFVF